MYEASDRADMNYVWSLLWDHVWAMYEASDRADMGHVWSLPWNHVWVMYGAYMKLYSNNGFDDMKASYSVNY